jgi:Na+/proline symporter
LWVGRITGVVVVLGGLIFAGAFKSVIDAIKFNWHIPPMVGLPLWAGFFWRRTTPAGAWAGALVSCALAYLSWHPAFISWLSSLPAAESLRLVVSTGAVESTLVDGQIVEQIGAGVSMYEPWKMLMYMTGGGIALVVVSLLTPRVAAKKLDRFYALLRTPVKPGEQVKEACSLPDGVQAPPPRKLLPLKDWEIPIPDRGAVVGFLALWGTVAAFIGGVCWLMTIR